jgi:hypothetical protein
MTFHRRYLLIIPVLALSACKGGGQSGSEAAAPAQEQVQNPVDSATAGAINGSVKFSGAKPKAQKIVMAADAYCKTAHTTDVFSPEVTVNPNNTLKWVYVYVKSGLKPDMKFPTPSTPVVLDQNGCMYSPHILAVQTNQTITVRNSDGVLHNINAKPKNNPGFNVGQPVKGMESPKSFPNPEVMVPLKCDVHPWMAAYVGVQSHPYFFVTGDDGSFTLPNLPPGEYEIEAWHEKYGASTQKVTIGPKETKTIEFTFKGA